MTEPTNDDVLEIDLAAEHDANEDHTVAEGTDADTSATQDMFPRKVVEDLRAENKKYRLKAKQVCFDAMVKLNGSLHDSTDLPFSDDYVGKDGLPTQDKVDQGITELLDKKPWLRKVNPSGDVGQGHRSAESFSLLNALR